MFRTIKLFAVVGHRLRNCNVEKPEKWITLYFYDFSVLTFGSLGNSIALSSGRVRLTCLLAELNICRHFFSSSDQYS